MDQTILNSRSENTFDSILYSSLQRGKAARRIWFFLTLSAFAGLTAWIVTAGS